MTPLTSLEDSDTNEFLDEDGNAKDTINKDFSKYSINEVGSYSKGKLCNKLLKCMQRLIGYECRTIC